MCVSLLMKLKRAKLFRSLSSASSLFVSRANEVNLALFQCWKVIENGEKRNSSGYCIYFWTTCRFAKECSVIIIERLQSWHAHASTNHHRHYSTNRAIALIHFRHQLMTFYFNLGYSCPATRLSRNLINIW